MKKPLVLVAGGAMVATVAGLAALSFVMAGHPSSASAAPSCATTNFYKDGRYLTAASIDPSGTVSGVIDAAGCDIGVYYGSGASGTVNHAEIKNAKYFGVLSNGGMVTVENSNIHNIGETPFNGDQHGAGVYWLSSPDHAASGRIVNNTISQYQKGGIVVRGVGSSAVISGNMVTGLGPVNFIAQNGIEVGAGATANVMGNTVSDNSYKGTDTASSGILIFGGACYGGLPYGSNIQVVGNTVINNDVGVWLSNLQADCTAPTTPTNNKVVNNTISSSEINNVYQAGVADVGNNDKIIHNNISGLGYQQYSSATEYRTPIDAASSFTNNAKVHANVA